MRRGLSIGALVVLVLLAPFAAAPSYRFPPAKPFTGPGWLNPYAGWSGATLKVNLHTHSRAWGGLTAGGDAPRTVAEAYAARGYGALGLSNYLSVEELEQPPLPMVRAYEHGLNVAKSHRLVLGTSNPVRFDFPVSTRSIRQFMLEAVGQDDAVVALAHPSLQQGHGCADVAALTGYDLLEVHNPYATSHLEWDCALSAGRLAWAIGDDDAHLVRDESIGVAWNRVESSATEHGILHALRNGRSYVVRGAGGVEEVALQSLELEGGVLTLALTGPATVEWHTDGGAVRQLDRDVTTARFEPEPTDHYVRVVVRTPQTEVLLNPVVRTGRWTAPRATIDWPLTVLGWLGWLAGALGAAASWPRRVRLQVVREVRAAA